MKQSAIILAAGKGSRYGKTKQDITFRGKTLWQRVYETTAQIINESRIIVVGKDIIGGETRAESVIKGLECLPEDTGRVVILEAARPMITVMQIKELLDCQYPSVSFVRPLVNTVVYRNGTYLNRQELYDLLTPQSFDYRLLLEAYHNGSFFDVTDETRVMYEYHGIKPHFIETDSNLFKVTYPGDMDIIESIYKNLLKEGKIL